MEAHLSTVARRSALTLIEVLVVLAAIGILLGVLLLAVQAARESMRRVACASSMRQVGLGALQYESQFRCLPSENSWSPYVYLIPFVEPSFVGKDRQELQEVHVPWIVCLSDTPHAFSPSHSFVFDYGTYLDPDDGAFNSWKSCRRLRDVTDGLSQTTGISEARINHRGLALGKTFTHATWNPEDYPQYITRCLDEPGESDEVGRGGRWYDDSLATLYTHDLTPNRVFGCEWSPLVILVAPPTSNHPGGVNLWWLDGRTTFMPDAVDAELWRAVGTVAGAEPTTAWR